MPQDANPDAGASEESAPAPSIEDQIAKAINLGDEEEPKKVPKEEDSKKSEEEEGDEPQPKSDDKKKDDSDDEESEDDESDNDESEEEEGEDSDDGESEEEDDKEPQFSTLEELAEAAEMSLDDIKSLFKGKIKVQGKEIEVTYDELLKGHMLEVDYRLKTSGHAEDVRKFNADKAEATEVIRANVIEATNVLQALTQEFIGENKNTNWEEMKRIDPDEYNLRRIEATEKGQKLEAWKAKLREHHATIQAQSDEKKGGEFKLYQTNQADNIKRLIPSWIDADVAEKESGEIRHWLKTSFDADMGFTDSEIDNLTDARFVSIVRKAMLSDSKLKKADHIKKKVMGTRKILKSKAKAPKKSLKKSHQEKTNRAIKSGDMRDASNAIAGLL